MSVTTFGTPSGVQQHEQLFTSSGTWTVPAGVKTCEVTVVGGSNYGGTAGSAAGGYYKGIVNVTGATTVPVTIGSGGIAGATLGGSSSFGTYVTAMGGGAGGFYRPTELGFKPGSVGILTGPFSILNGYYSGAYLNFDYSHLANNGRMYIYSNQNPGGYATSTDGINWVSTSHPYVPTSYNGKTISGGGNYITSYVNNANYAFIYYSSNGVDYSAATTYAAGYVTDIAYGPAGFLAVKPGPALSTSPTGQTWTAVAGTGLPSGDYYLQGTSSYYYAFQRNTNTSTAYRSTDGATWTSFTLNATLNARNDARFATSYNNKVYILTDTNTMQVIDGTSVTSVAIGVSIGQFAQHNSIYFGSSPSYYSVESPTVLVTANNFGIPNNVAAVVTSSGLAFGTSSPNSSGNFYTSQGAAGQVGFEWNSTGSASTNGTPGVLSAGSASPNSGYSYGQPGDGDENGWGCGVGGGGYGRKSYGSGAVNGMPGNQGVVKIRWWA